MPGSTIGAVQATQMGAASGPAALYLASAPRHNTDGTWEVVLGLQNADGILGLDLALQYDPVSIRMHSVTVLGIGAALTAESHTVDQELLIALYGVDPLVGSGTFLKVTYEVTTPVDGVPF